MIIWLTLDNNVIMIIWYTPDNIIIKNTNNFNNKTTIIQLIKNYNNIIIYIYVYF